jgi:hypothetical protein
MIAVQMGADLGLKPMQSLQNIAVINGRPSVWGDAALGLVMPMLERFVETMEGEGDTLTAICTAKRKGWPDETVRKFSVADARRANLWGKAGPWTNYPNRMLQMRARGFCLRDVAADCLMGLILAEEALDIPNEPTLVGASSTEPAKALVIFSQLPEPVQDNLERAFTTLNFSQAQRLQKLNEHFGGTDVIPDDAAQLLLDWLRDEFAKRKTGQPRAKSDNGKKVQKAKGEAPVSQEAPKEAGEVAGSDPQPDVKEGEALFD